MPYLIKKFWVGSLVLLWLFPMAGLSQTPTQSIRGRVLDSTTGQPLSGASLILDQIVPGKGTVADSLGNFVIASVAVGRHSLEVSYVGYESAMLPELLVESGKELVLEIALVENAAVLDAVLVRARRALQPSTARLSQYTITVEETLRFPATFNDPARLAQAYPGVAGDNDQANNLVIRGNAPGGLAWQLEGVEIVNPNHLSNAGTFSDRSTQNGGGVNMLSAQMLGASTFLTGAFPANYGNALAGVMDMRFRRGNNRRHEFTAQAGLIGLEAAAEGPLAKNRAAYLANFRYSTVGLLDALGVPLGDESISFADLAFHLSFPVKGHGVLNFFGFGGDSKNVFEAKRDTTAWEFEKDRNDIRFDSKMGSVGAKYQTPLAKRLRWNNVLLISGLEHERREDRLSNTFDVFRQSVDLQKEQKAAFRSELSGKINPTLQFRAGIETRRTTYDFHSHLTTSLNSDSLLRQGKEFDWSVEPFVLADQQLSHVLYAQAGLHLAQHTLASHAVLEPRASIRLQASEQWQLVLAYGLHSRLPPPQLYFEVDASGRQINNSLELVRAHHWVLKYQQQLFRALQWRTEVYYQKLFNVPIVDEPGSAFSVLNFVEGYRENPEALNSVGAGRNYGLETSLQRFLVDDYYFLINASLYESKYTGGDGLERDTRFNGNYIFNATAGKEWNWRKSMREKRLGINLRGVYLGGFRDTPIDESASAAAGRTIYLDAESFSFRQEAYFKIDLRLYLKNYKAGFNSTLALDVQNVTNRRNVAYTYFDVQKQQIVKKRQLGLIPILSYRIEF